MKQRSPRRTGWVLFSATRDESIDKLALDRRLRSQLGLAIRIGNASEQRVCLIGPRRKATDDPIRALRSQVAVSCSAYPCVVRTIHAISTVKRIGHAWLREEGAATAGCTRDNAIFSALNRAGRRCLGLLVCRNCRPFSFC